MHRDRDGRQATGTRAQPAVLHEVGEPVGDVLGHHLGRGVAALEAGVVVEVSLGGAFHSSRLGIRASQVGAVAAARRGSRTTRDRLVLALDLLEDPAFDAVVTGASPFEDLPEVMSCLADGSLSALCHRIDYEAV